LPAQEAAARAIFGESDIEGRLPVSIPGLYPAGHGLTLKKK
jgi:beta-N-acetylhexosaminidase